MKEGLLTFEVDSECNQLFIHGDHVGLRRLAKMLEHLAKEAENGEFPHEHLFSFEWGGDDLSTLTQEDGHNCLNHVKIYGWPTNMGSIPYKI